MNMEVDLSPSSRRFPQFKDIRKPTIQQTYQYVMKLVGNIQVENIENLNEVLDTSKPLPVFDESLRILVINRLNIENEVIKVLLSQNDDQIKRILNCNWFFKFLPLDFCAKELFPFVSVSLRCKIITKLSKHLESTEEAEKYFWFIKEKYGGKRADCMLRRCSKEFLIKYVDELKPGFRGRFVDKVLLKICHRFPEVGFYILSSLCERNKDKKDFELGPNEVLRYLAGRCPDEMVSFIEKYNSCMPFNIFGKKLTKKLGLKLKNLSVPASLKKEIIQRQESMFPLFPREAQIEVFYDVMTKPCSGRPIEDWGRRDGPFCKFLCLLPAGERLQMVKDVCFKIFKKDFDEIPLLWTYTILEALPTETRLPYLGKLEKHFEFEGLELEKNVHFSFKPSIESKEEFFRLFDTNTGLDNLQKILETSPPVAVRQRVLPAMVQNCKLNNDLNALQKVVEFVCRRHRNDEQQVLYGFINEIIDNYRGESLNSAIYEAIDNLMYFLRVKGFAFDYPYFLAMEKQIYYRLENNLNADTLVDKLSESVALQSQQVFIKDYKSKHTKTLILAVWERIHNWIKNNPRKEFEKKTRTLIMNMVATCRQYKIWSKRKEICLTEVPGLKDFLRQILASTFPDLGGDEWPLYLWNRHYGFMVESDFKQELLSTTIQQNPDLFIKQYENALNLLFSEYKNPFRLFFIRFMRAMSFSEKTDKVLEKMVHEFKNENNLRRRINALTFYSYVCTIEDFSKLIEEFIPKQEKIVCYNTSFDTIQLLIPKLIKFIKPRWKNFDLLSKFFFGDFLKNATLSFRTCCYYTRFDIVFPFLKERLKQMPKLISYEKEILKLIVEFSNQDERTQILMDFWDEFKDFEIRRFLFSNFTQEFLNRPSAETFARFEKCLTECDEKLIKSGPYPDQIPEEYFTEYIAALWKFSEKTSPQFRHEYRTDLILNIRWNNVHKYKPSFLKKIIEDNLFNPFSDLDLYFIACLYILIDPEQTKERLLFVMDLLKKRDSPQDYFLRFLNKILETGNPYSMVFEYILQNWPDYPEGFLYEERELFLLHSLYHSWSVCKPPELAKRLIDVFLNKPRLSELVVLYRNVLNKFIEGLGTLDGILTAKEIVVNAPNRTISILGITSLPYRTQEYYESYAVPIEEREKVKSMMDEMVKVLEAKGDKILSIYRQEVLGYVKP